MIIVKLTVLSLVVSAIYYFALRVWVGADTKRALLARITGKYPKWLYGFALFIFLDIIGIFTSAIYFLFLR